MLCFTEKSNYPVYILNHIIKIKRYISFPRRREVSCETSHRVFDLCQRSGCVKCDIGRERNSFRLRFAYFDFSCQEIRGVVKHWEIV